MDWIIDNAKWVFSGIGVVVVASIIGLIAKRRSQDDGVQIEQLGEGLTTNLGISNQTQVSGDHSTSYQGQSIVVHGISVTEAKSIALDVYKAKLPELQDEAVRVAQQRAEKLIDAFLDELKQKDPDAIISIKDPGMQIALGAAERDYAARGDEVLHRMLVDLLVQRAMNAANQLETIVLDGALKVAHDLSGDHLDALTVHFLLLRADIDVTNSREALLNLLNRDLLPFFENLTIVDTCTEHLEYAKCGSKMGLAKWPRLLDILKTYYPFVFHRGFTEDQFKSSIGDIEPYREFLMPCVNDESRFQFGFLKQSDLKRAADEKGLSEDIVKQLAILRHSSDIHAGQEPLDFLLGIQPNISKLFDIWDKTSLSTFDMTTVGVAIAQANFKRKTGRTVRSRSPIVQPHPVR